jgi:hypothetical protein
MIPHRLAAAVVGAALVAGLSGCASPALDESAGAQLQESVVAIADAAAAGDLAGAVGGLDELQTELDAAIAEDMVTAARAARIQAAIDAVRTDLASLQAATAPVETPAPVEPTDTTGTSGTSGDGDSGGGGNDNSGPGNNNGNGDDDDDDENGNGSGNGNRNGKKDD